MKLRMVVSVVSLLVAVPAHAGWLEDTVTNAAKRVTERGIDDAADGAYEHGKEAVTREPEEQEKRPVKKTAKKKKKESRPASESGEELDAAALAGSWLFNQARSKAAQGTSFSGSEVTLDIRQEQDSIEVAKTISTPGGMVDTMKEAFVLDGEEYVTEESSLVTTRRGSWSPDRTQLILRLKVKLGARELTTEDVYSLSRNGSVLTVQSTENGNPKARSILVYERQ